jgi:hypothetical protein
MKHRIIRDTDIWDERGLLRDHKIYRASMALMDHDTVHDRGPMRVQSLDAARDRNLNRPGFRVLDDAAGTAAKNRAYIEYEKSLCDAWRGDSEGFAENAEGMTCTVQSERYPLDYGSRGHVKRVDGQLICVPDNPRGRDRDDDDDDDASRERATSDARKKVKYDPRGRLLSTEVEEDDDEDDVEEAFQNMSTHSETGRTDARSVSKRHQQKMDALYERRDALLRDAWRSNK